MVAMTRQPYRVAPIEGARVRTVLLLLAVLSGLFAMHGLGPVSADRPAHAAPRTEAAANHPMQARTPAPAVAPATGTVAACEHHDHDGDVHLGHADAACAAAGVGAGPGMPSLPSAVVARAAEEPGPRRMPGAAVGARAPPSLSELQLLRI